MKKLVEFLIVLAAPVFATAAINTAMLNFTGSEYAGSVTSNDVIVPTSPATTGSWNFGDLANTDGSSSGVSASITYTSANGSAIHARTDGASAGITDGSYSWDAGLTNNYVYDNGGQFSLSLSGLEVGQEYSLAFYGGRNAYGTTLRILDCTVSSDGTTASDLMQTTRNGIPSTYQSWPLDIGEVSIVAGASGTATITLASAVTESGTAPAGTFPSGWWDPYYGAASGDSFINTDNQTHIALIQVTAVPEPAVTGLVLGLLTLTFIAYRRKRS